MNQVIRAARVVAEFTWRAERPSSLRARPAGSPQEALDAACTVYLTGLGHEPAP